MKLRVHADDLGACPAVTDAILQAHAGGVLQSSSLLVNTAGTSDALEKVSGFPTLQLALHLNLIEGAPLCHPSQVPDLVNRSGLFNGTISSLVSHGLRPFRKIIEEQLTKELRAQFQFFTDHLGPPKWVDSHLHLHALPWVYPIVQSLCLEFGVGEIRMPRRFVFLDGFGTEKRPVQTLKSVILSGLSQWFRMRGAAAKDDYVFTGVLSTQAVNQALTKIPPSSSVELLFHPGAPPENENQLAHHPAHLREVHFRPARALEREVLSSTQFRDVLQSWGHQGESSQEKKQTL